MTYAAVLFMWLCCLAITYAKVRFVVAIWRCPRLPIHKDPDVRFWYQWTVCLMFPLLLSVAILCCL